MTTVQLQRALNAKTFTKTVIDRKQSLEVVQTMLHGAVCLPRFSFSFQHADKTAAAQQYCLSAVYTEPPMPVYLPR